MKLPFCTPAGVALTTVVLLGATPPALPQTSSRIPITIVDPGPVGVVTTSAIFAHVAVGGGYTTVFTLVNTGADAAAGNLILTGTDGSPLDVTLAEPSASEEGINPVFASSTPITIPPGGTQVIQATSAGSTVTGWARVESEGGAINGVGTFQLAPGGTLNTIAGVLASETASVVTIPVNDDAAQNRFTGYAVANPGSAPVNIRIVLVNSNGTVFQTLNPAALNPLGPGRQTAGFLWQDLNNANLQFRGSMVLISQGGAQFAVVALVQDRGLFTAIPVIPSKAPNIN
jgi:hypothetical protein